MLVWRYIYIYIYQAREPLWESHWPSSGMSSHCVDEKNTSWCSPATCPGSSYRAHPVKPYIHPRVLFKQRDTDQILHFLSQASRSTRNCILTIKWHSIVRTIYSGWCSKTYFKHLVVLLPSCSYLCFCLNFVPEFLTQFKSCFAVFRSFTVLGEIILCVETDIQ